MRIRLMFEVQLHRTRRARADLPRPTPRVPMQRVGETVAVAGQIDRAAVEDEARIADTVAIRQQRKLAMRSGSRSASAASVAGRIQCTGPAATTS
jgi:hypothetical protein